MIRSLQNADVARVLDIWLQASLQAHDFVARDYWLKMQETVRRDYLPLAQTFVFVDKRQIKGFISVVGENHVGALFVAPQFQNQKIGSKLLEYVKRNRPFLTLKVFAQNTKALSFYRQKGFLLLKQSVEPSTKADEMLLSWAKGSKNKIKRQGDS